MMISLRFKDENWVAERDAGLFLIKVGRKQRKKAMTQTMTTESWLARSRS